MVLFADGLDRQIVEFLDRRGAGVQSDVIFELPDLRSSRRQNQILIADRVHHVGWRQPLGLQQRGLKVDHHLALLAAVGLGNGRALHGGSECEWSWLRSRTAAAPISPSPESASCRIGTLEAL